MHQFPKIHIILHSEHITEWKKQLFVIQRNIFGKSAHGLTGPCWSLLGLEAGKCKVVKITLPTLIHALLSLVKLCPIAVYHPHAHQGLVKQYEVFLQTFFST